jgi:hypothetical protein
MPMVVPTDFHASYNETPETEWLRSNPDIHKEHHLLITRFYDAHGALGMLMEKEHCDFSVFNPDSALAGMFRWAAYQGCKFEHEPIEYAIDIHAENHCFTISKEENDKIVSFGHRMQGMQYNYIDSRFLMPFCAPTSTFVEDVNSTNITRGFCSQLTLLMMRECMNNGPITRDLEYFNSRLTSPSDLLEFVRTRANSMTNAEYARIVHLGHAEMNASHRSWIT